MISPSNRYVGLGVFYSELTPFPNTTLGQFSGEQSMDETWGKPVEACVQTLEVSAENLVLGSCKVTGAVPWKAGQPGALKMTMSASGDYGHTDGLQVLGAVRWVSSNPSAASVDEKGTVFARGCGTVDITAMAANGMSAKRTFSLKHNWDGGVITKEPTVSFAGTKTFTCLSCKTVKTKKIPVVKLKKGKIYSTGGYKYKVTECQPQWKRNRFPSWYNNEKICAYNHEDCKHSENWRSKV